MSLANASSPIPNRARLLPRVNTFVAALSTRPALRALLGEAGYTMADHKEGLSLYTKVLGEAAAPPAVALENPAKQAYDALLAFQSGELVRGRAALERKHPEQESYAFRGVAVGEKVEAIGNVTVFLDRCDELSNAAERKATRKADHAALATLATRGITGERRKQLRRIVGVASTTDVATAPPPVDGSAFEASLLALHAWYRDWSRCAHSVIARRDYLIQLGLATRKPRKAAPIVVMHVVDEAPPSRAA